VNVAELPESCQKLEGAACPAAPILAVDLDRDQVLIGQGSFVSWNIARTPLRVIEVADFSTLLSKPKRLPAAKARQVATVPELREPLEGTGQAKIYLGYPPLHGPRQRPSYAVVSAWRRGLAVEQGHMPRRAGAD
jgi:hypothetical protein